MNNRVLVIAYYTPPLGLSGVMRVTKFCKYLPDFGWEPGILTVKPVAYYAYDQGLVEDLKRTKVFRTDSLDPNRVLYKLMSFAVHKVPEFRGSRVQLYSHSGNKLINLLFLPDAKIGWYPFAVSVGRKLIKEFRPQVVFATAPPWTALLIGARLCRETGLPFVADFRDPWPLGFQPPLFYQRPFLKRMLKAIFVRASLVLTVNKGTRAILEREIPAKVRIIEVLENGFDPEEFKLETDRCGPEGLPYKAEKSADFSIVYVGNLFGNRAEIEGFLTALSQIPEARFYLVGAVDRESQQLLEGQSQVKLIGNLPHTRAIALMKGADALLYIGKPNQPVGLKLYEYLGAGKPIVIWGKGAVEAAALIEEFDAGMVCDSGEGLRRFLKEVREDSARFKRIDRKRLDRRNQAEFLATRLRSLL
ncbi:MAG: glycosyltransferase [bacterium]